MNNKSLVLPLLTLTVAAAGTIGVTACSRAQAAKTDPVALGRHIVENVAMCVDCHTPHLPDGRLDPDRNLMGSALPFTPTVPMPWAGVAPQIAGLPMYPDDASAVKFLTTGETAHGGVPRPPMPPYRLNRDEAQAVVAYLRSLKPAGS